MADDVEMIGLAHSNPPPYADDGEDSDEQESSASLLRHNHPLSQLPVSQKQWPQIKNIVIEVRPTTTCIVHVELESITERAFTFINNRQSALLR
jgi:hypothetical protein